MAAGGWRRAAGGSIHPSEARTGAAVRPWLREWVWRRSFVQRRQAGRQVQWRRRRERAKSGVGACAGAESGAGVCACGRAGGGDEVMAMATGGGWA